MANRFRGHPGNRSASRAWPSRYPQDAARPPAPILAPVRASPETSALRERIASTIHDEAIQAAAAATLRLDVIAQQVESDRLRGELAVLRDDLGELIDRLRHMVFDLAPGAVAVRDLEVALRGLVQRVRDESGLVARLEYRVERTPTTAAAALLYAVAAEATANVRDHARASRVEVSAATDRAHVRLAVRDDGAGFPAPVPEEPLPGHRGLPALRTALDRAGGELTIATEPGRGSTVEARVPIGARFS